MSLCKHGNYPGECDQCIESMPLLTGTPDNTKPMTLEQVHSEMTTCLVQHHIPTWTDINNWHMSLHAHLAPREVTDEDVDRGVDAWDNVYDGVSHNKRDAIREVIQSDRQPVAASVGGVRVPDGWKLVPLNPTANMEDAAFDTFEIDDAKTQGFNSGTDARNAIYRAMLAAAPASDAEGDGNG